MYNEGKVLSAIRIRELMPSFCSPLQQLLSQTCKRSDIYSVACSITYSVIRQKRAPWTTDSNYTQTTEKPSKYPWRFPVAKVVLFRTPCKLLWAVQRSNEYCSRCQRVPLCNRVPIITRCVAMPKTSNYKPHTSGALHIISVYLYCWVLLKPNYVVIQQSRISGDSVPSRQFNFQGKNGAAFIVSWEICKWLGNVKVG